MEKLDGALSSLRLRRAAPGQISPSTPAEPACPICHDMGYIREDVSVTDPSFGKAIPCACKEKEIEERRRQNLLRVSQLDPFADKTFDTFDGSVPGLRDAFEAAMAFARDPSGWLILQGPFGCGKTHLAAAIAHEVLSLGEGIPVLFSNVPDLLDHLRATFGPHSETTYDELFEGIKVIGLLVLDDLGSENTTGWAEEKLYQIINYRYNYRLPTVFTTNNNLLTSLDPRIHSRLRDKALTRICQVEGADYRERAPARRATMRPNRAGSP